MKHLGTKDLETGRMILRRFTMEDAVPMFRNWANDPEVTKYLTWPCHGTVAVTEMVLRDWVAGYGRADQYKWAITLKGGNGEPIGSIDACKMDDDLESAEIGYCMGKQWWGGGLMTEALTAVVAYLIGEVGLNRVGARHDVRNIGSGRVMQKAGMSYEGTLRQFDRNNQGICDTAYYSILKSEWTAK